MPESVPAQPPTPTFNGETGKSRPFRFEQDTFAFVNETVWEYRFDAAGNMTYTKRDPRPDYSLRCFVLTRAARQFFYNARFDARLPRASKETYLQRVKTVVSSNPRKPCPNGAEIVIPGYSSLREFSTDYEAMLKAECGGAWRSYVLRSHWRMVFPISRTHQLRTARQLVEHTRANAAPIIHLVTFPKLSINHGMVLYDVEEKPNELKFAAYDPNDPSKPTHLTYDFETRAFSLPANRYWGGGKLDIIEIFRGWLM